ncbi:permease-like cell division protein FtsX [uncultured Peptoniphilus sp.]|uniref:permease-like cell division protein FtsX n=1 Tax=uncultured Peptoniphilus sp. TaxID=254354 RepID=UPI00280599F7|nr:permease-like cell division protein FtsX [uncultured Peptoniphilus sp.]
MSLIRQFFNIFKEALKGIWRNKTMAFTSTISIASMLTLFGIVFLLVLNLNTIVFQTGEKLDKVIFYLNDDAPATGVNNFINELAKNDDIKKVDYVSREEALEDFKSGFSEDVSVLENMPGGNPLPASINIEMKDLSLGLNLKNKYKDLPIVEDVEYQYDFVAKMMKFENGVKYVGIAIVAILLLVSILIMHNTIKIAISNRENEISIMRYVGATNTYIRGPFLIEGVLFGIFGALIAGFLTINFYSYLFERVNSELFRITNTELVSSNLVTSDLIIIYLCIGVGIGFLGSLFSTKKFLNV